MPGALSRAAQAWPLAESTWSHPFPGWPNSAGMNGGMLGNFVPPSDAWNAGNSGLLGAATAPERRTGILGILAQSVDEPQARGGSGQGPFGSVTAPDDNWRPRVQLARDTSPGDAGAPRLGLPPVVPPDIIPGTPEWWEHAKRGHQGLWDFLLHLRRGVTSGSSGGDDDEDCRKERQEAFEECQKALASGWRGDYGTGPYKKRSPGRWTLEDCIRGRVSQRCGGNRID